MVSVGRVAALGQTITMEMKHDIHKNVILRDIWRDSLTKGHAEVGRKALYSLPSWAPAHLRKATPNQTQLWSRKILTAAILEAVVGRK